MKTKIETFCEELTQKSNKKITFEAEEIIPNVNGGENYRLFADGTKTKVILSENIITNNIGSNPVLTTNYFSTDSKYSKHSR